MSEVANTRYFTLSDISRDDMPDILVASFFSSTSHRSIKSISNPASSESILSIQVVNNIEKFIVDSMCQVYLHMHSKGNSKNKLNEYYRLLISYGALFA